MSGTVKSKKGRIANVIADTTLTGTLTCTGISNHGAAMYNAPRPCCYIRDKTAVNLNAVKNFTGGEALVNTGGMWSSTAPTVITFPVKGWYTVQVLCYSTASILTSAIVRQTMTVTNGVSTANPMDIGASTLYTNPQILSSSWSGYQTAGATATFQAISTLPSNWNSGGLYNYVQACLIHYL